MSETNNVSTENVKQESAFVEEEQSFNLKEMWYLIVRFKYWFLLSVAICVGLAYLYAHMRTPIYRVDSKILIKDKEQRRPTSQGTINATFAELGFMNSSNGFDNEIEVLATFMKLAWVRRTVDTWENIKADYDESDFS